MPSLSREQALATLDQGYAAVERLLARLTEEELTRPAAIGGGDWSARDLLGHLACWEELAARTIDQWQAGQRPSVEQIADGGQAAIDQQNARYQAETTGQPLAAVRERARIAHAALTGAIRGLSDAAWSAPAPYPNPRSSTLAECLGTVVGADGQPFGHAFEHLPDLRDYVATLGRATE